MNTNNNWQDLIYHDAMQTGANAGISGGSEKGTYYLDFGYLNQDGIMVGSNFKRYSVKLSIDQAATSWLQDGSECQLQQNKSENGSAECVWSVWRCHYQCAGNA